MLTLTESERHEINTKYRSMKKQFCRIGLSFYFRLCTHFTVNLGDGMMQSTRKIHQSSLNWEPPCIPKEVSINQIHFEKIKPEEWFLVVVLNGHSFRKQVSSVDMILLPNYSDYILNARLFSGFLIANLMHRSVTKMEITFQRMIYASESGELKFDFAKFADVSPFTKSQLKKQELINRKCLLRKDNDPKHMS